MSEIKGVESEVKIIVSEKITVDIRRGTEYYTYITFVTSRPGRGRIAFIEVTIRPLSSPVVCLFPPNNLRTRLAFQFF